MFSDPVLAVGLLALAHFTAATAEAAVPASPRVGYGPTKIKRQQGSGKLSPKVVIVSMFDPEAEVWYEGLPGSGQGDLFANNITIPGLSPLYPEVHCTKAGDICQVTTGEAEINTAATMTAFVLSEKFDLTHTYFLTGGIAGVNPKIGTLGSVALARFVVQVALQYEFDAREMPENFTTGYLPYGAYAPDQYPTIVYGTEVMKVNEALRDAVYAFAQGATLSDSDTVAGYRQEYRESAGLYAAAVEAPSILRCDAATSDVYYSGILLSEAFENTSMIWTNQSDITYCMTAQEDSAILQVLMRAAIGGLVDFSRTIVMRTGSDFDRPSPSVSAFDHLRMLDQNGFDVAIENLFLAGVEIVKGILVNWDCEFEEGIRPRGYVGDILGSLGGEPDFGPGSVFGGAGVSKRDTQHRGAAKRVLSGRRAGGWK